MSLQSIYEAFLASPKIDTLATDASLSYITTLTSFHDSASIIKHLEAQRRRVRKKSEKVLSAIADRHALFLEVETTLEFVNSGGAYLPGLDDNFLADHVAVLPIQHVVHFNSDGKIKQIRLYWDQGSLLKNVDVIGSRAKNWPIKDGKDQIRLITSSAQAEDPQGSTANDSRRQSSTRPTKDPHGTLEPFAANIPEEHECGTSFGEPAVAPRASAKPAPREWDELFVNQDEERARGTSPSKADAIAPKIGAGKNFQENRLFGEAQDSDNEMDNKFISPHPTKFNHFEFHDGHNDAPPQPKLPKPKTKHQSQWDFSDFTTPAQRPQQKQDTRTFAFDEKTPEQSPVRKPYVPHARRDADKHFELLDDGESEHPRPAGHQRGQNSTQINNKVLFSNNVISEEGALDPNSRGRPMSILSHNKDRQNTLAAHWDMTDNPTHGDIKHTGTGADIKNRHKDFDPHFKMTDSPNGGEKREEKRPLRENQSKVVRMMEANWQSSDPNNSGPVKGNQSTGVSERSVNIAGNGMGSRKTNEQWSLGDDGSDAPRARGMGIAGNGMGGRAGVEREWGLGDHDQPTKKENAPIKINRSNQRSEMWDN